jgi:hypothetical protein
VNEHVGAESGEVSNEGPLPVPETLDDIDYPVDETESSLKPRREGLPPGFRMRHDRHYVEELMASSTINPATTYPSARPSVPAIEPPPRRSAAALELIAGRLESIVAHGEISRGPGSPTDLVGRSVQAELQRVSRFARAVAIIAHPAEPIRRAVTNGEIAAAVRAACTRLVRLYGMQCVVTTDDAGFAIGVERALVVQAIAGTLDALLDLAQGAGIDDGAEDAGRFTVALQAVKARPALIAEIGCPSVVWDSTPDRLFENRDEHFAATPAAGILLAAAAQIVRVHGGRAEAQVQGGLRIRYVLPQDPPRSTTVS